MLGDKISEAQGKVTSQRVLPGADHRYVQMEITIQEQGTFFGEPGMNMGTYTAFERVPGQLYGEGHGVVALQSGETAIWNGHGVGRMGEGMTMSFRFSLAFQAPTTGKLAQLNGFLGIGEHEVDAAQNTRTTTWAWK
jgi:hypothetical protein